MQHSIFTIGHSTHRLVRMVNLPEEDMFHSREELLAEAYRRQEERIAYEAVAADTMDGATVRGAVE
jgi:hypothetical protein